MAQILVVDDLADAAHLLAAILQSDGHTVGTAYDGLQAIGLMSSFIPDWVLLDINMPRVDGFGVARFIRAQDWGSRVKVVAMTGWAIAIPGSANKQYLAAATRAGFDVHLGKPLDLEAVARLVSEAGNPAMAA